MYKRFLFPVFALVAACSSDAVTGPDSAARFASSNANSARLETFDVPLGSCNTFDNGAFTMQFTINGVASGDCFVGAGGPGNGTAGGIIFPNTEGGAQGMLRINFAHPTRNVEFDLAQSFLGALPHTAVVKLYKPGAGVLTQETELILTADPIFVAGHFAYTGGAVSAVEVYFVDTVSRFALDNVAYIGKQ